jgi:hypothetical protein
MDNKIKKEKKTIEKPIMMLYILLFIAGLMGFGALYYNYKKDKEKTYISNPQKGDVYSMALKNGHYSTARVGQVKTDSIYLTYNDYEIDVASKIDEIDIPRNYSIDIHVTTQKILEELFNKDTIYEITRK